MRRLIAVLLVSAAIIAFQLILIHIISITQWYHFAYMVISIALLGFGVAGTTLSIFKKWFLRYAEHVFHYSLLICCISMLLVLPLSQFDAIRFDSYLLFAERRHILNLIITYLLYFIPFYTGALALGVVFYKYSENIGSIYFANLVGSAIGGLSVPVVSWWLDPELLPVISAIMVLGAGLLTMPGVTLKSIFAFGTTMLLLILISVYPPNLHVSQFKGISKILDMPEASVVSEEHSPYGQLQLVSAPTLRHGHGVSLKYRSEIPVQMAIFNNGNWVDAVLPSNSLSSWQLLKYTPKALPYQLVKPDRVMMLEGGAFNAIPLALKNGAQTIEAVTGNPQFPNLLRSELQQQKPFIRTNNRIEIVPQQPRTHLLSSTQQYDLITLPDLGAFGGSSGINAIREDYMFTTESMANVYARLKPGGMAFLTTWIDYPFKKAIRLANTINAAFRQHGIHSPAQHIAIIKSWGTYSFLISKSPLDNTRMTSMRSFCDSLGFETISFTGSRIDWSSDSVSNDQLLRAIFSGQSDQLTDRYTFRINPATDQRPFFHQFLKWDSIEMLGENYDLASLPFFEIGYLVVWITLIQILVIALVLIVLPMYTAKDKKNGSSGWILIYFGCIGIGYMFIEIFLLQKSVLYFGNPVYAAAASISVLLLFAGLGSYVSEYKNIHIGQLKYIFVAIACLIVLMVFWFDDLLKSTIHLGLFYKVLIFCMVLIPMAFLMGFPFPVAIRHLSKIRKHSIPWAWAINGFFSVISTVCATILAVELGFNWVLLLAGLTYFIPVLLVIRTDKVNKVT